jgi:hypothetical protein
MVGPGYCQGLVLSISSKTDACLRGLIALAFDIHGCQGVYEIFYPGGGSDFLHKDTLKRCQ